MSHYRTVPICRPDGQPLTTLGAVDELLNAFKEQGGRIVAGSITPIVHVTPNPLIANGPPVRQQLFTGAVIFEFPDEVARVEPQPVVGGVVDQRRVN